MPNGFSSTGGFNNNRKQTTLYSTPYGSAPFLSVVYQSPASQGKFAYWILNNGSQQSNRIRNFLVRR